MKKVIIFSLLSLVVGIAIGLVGGMAYFGPGMASSMFMFQESEIIEFEQAAIDAYRNQPTEVAIWALEYYVSSLNKVKEQRASADTEDPYVLLTPDISLTLTHGRLSQLYKKLNDEEKYKYHLEKAITIYNEARKYKIDEEKLIELISKLDADSKN